MCNNIIFVLENHKSSLIACLFMQEILKRQELKENLKNVKVNKQNKDEVQFIINRKFAVAKPFVYNEKRKGVC